MSGVQRSMLEIFRYLDRSTFEPAVVCQSTGPLTEELQRLHIPYHLVPSLGREIRPWRDARAYLALKRLFRAERFDLVHNQSAKPRVVAGLAARHAGVPVIINHVRCYPFHNGTSRWREAIYRRVEACAERWCDKTLYVNNEERANALATRLTTASRSRTIYNGVDLVRFSPANHERFRAPFRQAHGLGQQDVLILFLGRLEEPKQPLILPRIAQELERRVRRPWQLLVCGEGGYRPRLEEAISRVNLSHRFRFLGWQASPDSALHASDIVLLPSIWEGCPRVLLEAHAAGLPTVGSNVCGIREVISDRTGSLVDSHDAAGFADALASLIDNPLERKRMGMAARKRAERFFDTRRNNLEIVNVYCSLLGAVAPCEIGLAA
jgi:glycosyltransferase involved in cell wall biosynthesis